MSDEEVMKRISAIATMERIRIREAALKLAAKANGTYSAEVWRNTPRSGLPHREHRQGVQLAYQVLMEMETINGELYSELVPSEDGGGIARRVFRLHHHADCKSDGLDWWCVKTCPIWDGT